MKAKSSTINIAVSLETHALLVNYTQLVDGKIGKISDRVLREFVKKELAKRVS